MKIVQIKIHQKNDRRWFELNSRTSCWPIEYKLNYFTWQADRQTAAIAVQTRGTHMRCSKKMGISKRHSSQFFLFLVVFSPFFLSYSISLLVSLSLSFFIQSPYIKWSSRQNFETRYDKLWWLLTGEKKNGTIKTQETSSLEMKQKRPYQKCRERQTAKGSENKQRCENKQANVYTDIRQWRQSTSNQKNAVWNGLCVCVSIHVSI